MISAPRRLVHAAWLLAVLSFHCAIASRAGTTNVLFETRFEPSEGYDPEVTLVGQGGWVGFGSGGNGLVTNFLAGRGQHAFIGYVAPTNNGDFLNVWRPVNYTPAPPKPTRVRFTVTFSVEDSATKTNRDDFRWSVYNVAAERLFSVDFDNDSLGINTLLDDDVFVPTGRTFTNSVPYQLEILMDFATNLWSAKLDGSVLAEKKPMTTQGRTLDFGDVDAVWAIRTPGKPGDNFMVFDDYRVVAEDPTARPAPRLEALGLVKPGQLLVRCRGTAGVEYILQGGPDLRTWVPLKTNTMPADGFFDHLDQGAAALRFYRVAER